MRGCQSLQIVYTICNSRPDSKRCQINRSSADFIKFASGEIERYPCVLNRTFMSIERFWLAEFIPTHVRAKSAKDQMMRSSAVSGSPPAAVAGDPQFLILNFSFTVSGFVREVIVRLIRHGSRISLWSHRGEIMYDSVEVLRARIMINDEILLCSFFLGPPSEL